MKDWQLQQLLEDVEGDSGRKATIFLDICKANTQVYGESGSETRRMFQKKLDRLKGTNKESYLNLLKKMEVEPNFYTLNESEVVEEEEVKEGDVVEDATNTSVEFNHATNDTPGKLADVGYSTGTMSTGTTWLDGVSANNTQTLSPPPLKTASPTPPHSKMAARLSSKKALELVITSPGNGTKNAPFLVNVCAEYPERNFGFNITKVRGIKFEGYKHTGYHIRHTVPVQDAKLWEARMCKYLGLEARAIVVKSPSIPYWEADTDRYHERMKVSAKSECEATKDAHKETEVAVGKEDSERKFVYWLLLFPSSVTLDNTIFSHGTDRIKAEVVGMKEKYEMKKTNTHYGCVLFWRIAEKNNSVCIEDVDTSVDVTDCFDD